MPATPNMTNIGDFTQTGMKKNDVADFNEWLGKLDFEEKFVIAGKGDMQFERKLVSHVSSIKL